MKANELTNRKYHVYQLQLVVKQYNMGMLNLITHINLCFCISAAVMQNFLFCPNKTLMQFVIESGTGRTQKEQRQEITVTIND